ncbi:uncharacterized protein LOC107370963 isoform X2 [Tetranychus urticae]|uniref:uncharacterized protein LOC107370963 isoform X2 n=1 Tax=Tetranychus urticae TaxID=32264 RepID=UPI00077B97B9|nr:uncharacterized protein LOC107370963 isoform X2 [Tetranychus urticae]
MNSLETDDQLTIVNRSTEHRVSKKLIRKVPYFEKLLSHECFESKENAVVLDFDEQAFKLFLKWVEFDQVVIEMMNLINLCTMIDYFGMDTKLIDDCATYFHDKFSIKHLPVVIPQVTPTSKLINSGALDAFICRYFLKIASTKVWLNYPIETIEYICALDLMVHSEMQVFNAIMKWIDFKRNSRKGYLERLLKLVRWCHLDDKDSVEIEGNDFIRFSFLKDVFSPLDQRNDVNRTNQYYFVLVETLDGTDLQIKVFDRDFLPFIKRVIKLDESLPLHLLHNDHVSDIVIDSGRQMIRVDWNQNKYRFIGLNDYKSHHYKIQECILEKTEEKQYSLATYSIWAVQHTSGASLLEFNDKSVLLAEERISCAPSRLMSDPFDSYTNKYSDYELNMCCWTAPTDGQISRFFNSGERNYLTTILNNKIYIMKDRCELIQFNIESQEMKKFRRKDTKKLLNVSMSTMKNGLHLVLCLIFVLLLVIKGSPLSCLLLLQPFYR